jgi:hypothetical protein
MERSMAGRQLAPLALSEEERSELKSLAAQALFGLRWLVVRATRIEA